MPLNNRVALVTGASQGIGMKSALALAAQGMKVAITYRTRQQAAQRVLKSIQAMGVAALALPTDVTDPLRVKETVEGVVQQFGRLDVLVNNVGEFEWKSVAQSNLDEWKAVIASNLYSVFYVSKAVLPMMRRQRWGRIINFGSAGADRSFGQAKISAYSAAKAAVVAFSRSLALEEASHGITVNVVSPAIIDDDDLSVDEARRMTDARYPVGRPATAQDVAQAVGFFASEESSFITGQVLNVTGGWML